VKIHDRARRVPACAERHPHRESLTPGAALYLHNGRGLAAYTHDDALYQAYLIAYLVLNTINNGARRS